jgi:hypothetical protein
VSAASVSVPAKSAIFLLLCLTLAACGKGLPVPTERTATSSPPTATDTLEPPTLEQPTRQSLPPTWTAQPTITPRPTNTPLPTPTVTPTIGPDVICKNFAMISAPVPTVPLEYGGSASFAWHGVPQDVTLMLSITVHGSLEGIRVEIPVAGDSTIAVPFARLPGAGGDYDWKIWLQHAKFGAICEHSGAFIRKSPPYM